MTPSVQLVRAGLLVLVLLPMLAVAGSAGDSKAQFGAGASFFTVSPACPARQFPTFEAIVPVPAIFDPFNQDLARILCQVQVKREGKGVKRVKGKYESELIVRDNNTNDLDAFRTGSGVWRTDKEGRARFAIEIPAEIFADGFESGDVSAWSYIRTDLTNKKRGDTATVQCDTGTSRSQQTTWVTDDR